MRQAHRSLLAVAVAVVLAGAAQSAPAKDTRRATPVPRKTPAATRAKTTKPGAASPFATAPRPAAKKGSAAKKVPAAKNVPASKNAPVSRKVRDAASADAATACRPCEHADDCPKVTCECDRSTGTNVGACDTEETHCCASPHDACTAFCAANDQLWTGKFGTASTHDSAETPPPHAAEPSADDAGAAACLHPCDEAGDCPTISCQCKKAVARDVAACDVNAKCCGDERVVCEHFCGARKDRWTGKLVEDEAPQEAPPDELAPPDATAPDIFEPAGPDDDLDAE